MQIKYVSVFAKLKLSYLNLKKKKKKKKTKTKQKQQKQLDRDSKLKLNGERLYVTNSVKNFGVKIDEHLTWKLHIDGMSAKLNKANAVLSKITH